MPLKLLIDPGGEKLLPFAKNKLRQMKKEMAALGRAFATKWFTVDTGERIFLQSQAMLGSGVSFDTIRINAGVADLVIQVTASRFVTMNWACEQRLLFDASTGPAPFNTYSLQACVGTKAVLTNFSLSYVVDVGDFAVTAGPVVIPKPFPITMPYSRQQLVSYTPPFALPTQSPAILDLDLALTQTGPSITQHGDVNGSFTRRWAVADNLIYYNHNTSAAAGPPNFDVTDPATGSFTNIEWSSGADNGASAEMCANDRLLFRAVATALSAHSSFEVCNLAGTKLQTILVDASSNAWIGMACDNDNLICIHRVGTTVVAKLYALPQFDEFGVLPTLEETDVSDKFSAFNGVDMNDANLLSRICVINRKYAAA